MASDLLSTAETAELLEVKPSTVYAYVSRGLLTPIKHPGRRGSRFSAAEVTALRRGRPTTQGLVIESAITLIEEGRYWYRGHDALHLASTHTYEAVADVVMQGRPLPEAWTRDEPAGIAIRQAGQRAVSAGAFRQIQGMVLALAARSPSPASPAAMLSDGRTAITTVAGALAGGVSPDTAVAEALATALGNEAAAPAIDHALGLLADHGLAASTTAVRVAAGYGASIHQVLLAGLATLSGPLHGGASVACERLLRRALEADLWTATAEALAAGPMPGLGQPLYPAGDPRHRAIVERLGGSGLGGPVTHLLADLDELVAARGWEKPNVDMALGALTIAHGLEPGAGEAIFAIGRMAGWVAHAVEAVTADRIRPRARYVGPRPGEQPAMSSEQRADGTRPKRT